MTPESNTPCLNCPQCLNGVESECSSPASNTPSTLWAMRENGMIHFTDYVYEGEKVDIYESVEAAEEEVGPVVQMVVCRDEDDWWLEMPDAS